MLQNNILFDIDITLREFVSSSLKGIPGLEEPIISVGMPSSITNNVNVCIFRYAIKENKFYKNQQEIHGLSESKPPVVVDLYYMIIPFAKTEHESEILTRLLRAFYDEPILAGNRLKEDLISSGNTELKMLSHDLSISDSAHLWGLFDKAFRPFLTYIVTSVKIPSLIDNENVLVKEKILTYSNSNGDFV